MYNCHVFAVKGMITCLCKLVYRTTECEMWNVEYSIEYGMWGEIGSNGSAVLRFSDFPHQLVSVPARLVHTEGMKIS